METIFFNGFLDKFSFKRIHILVFVFLILCFIWIWAFSAAFAMDDGILAEDSLWMYLVYFYQYTTLPYSFIDNHPNGVYRPWFFIFNIVVNLLMTSYLIERIIFYGNKYFEFKKNNFLMQ